MLGGHHSSAAVRRIRLVDVDDRPGWACVRAKPASQSNRGQAMSKRVHGVGLSDRKRVAVGHESRCESQGGGLHGHDAVCGTFKGRPCQRGRGDGPCADNRPDGSVRSHLFAVVGAIGQADHLTGQGDHVTGGIVGSVPTYAPTGPPMPSRMRRPIS